MQDLDFDPSMLADELRKYFGGSAPNSLAEAPALSIPARSDYEDDLDFEGLGIPKKSELDPQHNAFVAAHELAREQKIQKIRALRDISEGMGNVFVPTVGEIRRGMGQRRSPFVAEDLRADEARIRGQVGGIAEIPELKKLGVTPEMDLANVQKLQGLLKSYSTTQNPIARARLQLDLANLNRLIEESKGRGSRAEAEGKRKDVMLSQAERRLDQKDKEIASIQARANVNAQLRERGIDLQEESLNTRQIASGRVPNATVDRLRMYEEADLLGQQLLSKFKSAGDPNTGVIPNWFQGILKIVGIEDTEYQALKGDAKALFARALYGDTGKQINLTEMGMKAEELPTFEDDQDTFIAKMNSFLNRIKQSKGVILDMEQRNRRDVRGFREGAPLPPSPVPIKEQKVRVIWSDGSTDTIDRALLDEARKHDPGVKIEGQ